MRPPTFIDRSNCGADGQWIGDDCLPETGLDKTEFTSGSLIWRRPSVASSAI